MFKPKAMRAMISPQTTPFKIATVKLEITNLVLWFEWSFTRSPSIFILQVEARGGASGEK